MRFLYTADLHLSRYGQDKVDSVSSLPERLLSIRNSLYHMSSYCRDNDIETMIIGGDLLHGKSIIYAIAQDIMLEYFRNNKDLKFIVIDGNHDLSGKGKDDIISALKPLDSENNVHRVQADHEFMDNMLLVPYSSNMIDIIKNNEAPILISHFGLNEGILNSGISIIADIGIKDLVNKYKLVLLGHYHKPQEIINELISLYYVGSSVQLDWGEKHEEKRFLIVDSDTLQVESIPTEGYTKFYEFELKEENKDEVVSEARQLIQEGHHVNIKKVENIDTSSLSKEFRIIDRVDRDITNRGISTSMSQEDRLRRYCEVKGIPEDQIDKYITAALHIIDSCSDKLQNVI